MSTVKGIIAKDVLEDLTPVNCKYLNDMLARSMFTIKSKTCSRFNLSAEYNTINKQMKAKSTKSYEVKALKAIQTLVYWKVSLQIMHAILLRSPLDSFLYIVESNLCPMVVSSIDAECGIHSVSYFNIVSPENHT